MTLDDYYQCMSDKLAQEYSDGCYAISLPMSMSYARPYDGSVTVTEIQDVFDMISKTIDTVSPLITRTRSFNGTLTFLGNVTVPEDMMLKILTFTDCHIAEVPENTVGYINGASFIHIDDGVVTLLNSTSMLVMRGGIRNHWKIRVEGVPRWFSGIKLATRTPNDITADEGYLTTIQRERRLTTPNKTMIHFLDLNKLDDQKRIDMMWGVPVLAKGYDITTHTAPGPSLNTKLVSKEMQFTCGRTSRFLKATIKEKDPVDNLIGVIDKITIAYSTATNITFLPECKLIAYSTGETTPVRVEIKSSPFVERADCDTTNYLEVSTHYGFGKP